MNPISPIPQMEKYIIPNLRNACLVVKLLATKGSPMSTREISDELDIPRTTAMRILSTLVLEGFAKKEGERYSLGTALISIGSSAKSNLDIGELSKNYLANVTEQTGETCHLAVPSGNRSMIVEVSFSPHPLSSSRGPGALVELHCSATGKCFLTYTHRHKISEIISETDLRKHTDKTIVTMDHLRDEIGMVKKHRYAMDEQEFFEGVRCIAAPVFDSNNSCVAAMGVTASTSRFTTNLISDFATILRRQADDLSYILGWKGHLENA